MKRKRDKILAVNKLKRRKFPEIYVGRIDKSNPKKVSSIKGFKKIKIHTSKAGYGELSPYHLKTSEGYIMENVWQFSKIYEKTRKVKLRKSRWHPKDIIWEWPSEVHMIDGKPTKKYWKWRKKGFKNYYPVRYPNSFHGRGDAVCSIIKNKDGSIEKIGYIEARKKIYCKVFWDCCKDNEKFKKLKKLYESGENLLILDVDGPDYHESFPYNTVKRGELGEDRVDTILANEQNIKALLKNRNRSFGHGYVIASLLQDKKWIGID